MTNSTQPNYHFLFVTYITKSISCLTPPFSSFIVSLAYTIMIVKPFFFFLLTSVVRMRKVCGNKYTYKMSIAGRIKCDGATDTRRFVLKSLPEGQSVCLEVDLKSRTWSPFKIDASEKQTPLY